MLERANVALGGGDDGVAANLAGQVAHAAKVLLERQEV